MKLLKKFIWFISGFLAVYLIFFFFAYVAYGLSWVVPIPKVITLIICIIFYATVILLTSAGLWDRNRVFILGLLSGTLIYCCQFVFQNSWLFKVRP